MDSEKYQRVRNGAGFVAALDQSGGSTPAALHLYGIDKDAYSGPEEMFDLVHQLRTRIITSPSFDGERVMGAILFENTMNRQVEGSPTGDYLWNSKGIVPFLKIDQGLAPEQQGAQLMKPIPHLDDLLSRAAEKHMFGTKMRSVIKLPGDGVGSVVEQQFGLARQILVTGLVPIIEPEVDIRSPRKAEVEDQLKAAILAQLDKLGDDQSVILKVTLPERADFYREFVDHPRVIRVLALSGGYTRAQATTLLARNHGVIASFSRALTEGLSTAQSPAQFNAVLDEAINAIATASRT
ncbi:fructose bisphosphate aldolase [Micrococcus luteus]|uniref:fructose bisphosphate aldolase n=1 Tax=Micrococcus luteus TaxID=1270 RepID=UPI0029D9E440|nr:fructose bisphosphate aldolase [Micrococcus luteus]MCV7494666.1 fructose bisphosphate aldolase [Micrococcus luteus]MCV7579652.1 fructose bisphosphate aldolase [Micrococcus luteus]MCV7634389.1 fructose bisphosphate aldolase [Micrococcus luteus]MCV7652293.1 fructose bisphosphate aldolase [Micrococcus luteus]